MKRTFALILSALLLVCSAASAQEYVSVAELYEQAQAMSGVWQETFETKNGTVTVDVPIIVPDVDAMPVLTMEGAKISEELYNHILQGKKVGREDQIFYDEVELGGKINEFFLGYENDYKNGVRTDIVGYEAVDTLWIQHGAFRISQGGGKVASTEPKPTTFHFPWQLDVDQPCMRGSNLTLVDAMRLWQEDIDMCFPDDDFVIQPVNITVYGSKLTEKNGTDKKYKNTGYYTIYAEQVVDGVPLMGGIMSDVGRSKYSILFGSTQKTNRTIEKWNETYGAGVASVLDYSGMESRFVDEESYRVGNSLARIRSVEYLDVPLASLDSVLESIGKEIKTGNIREVYSVRLGYVLYSDPDMIDHAWAIPRWVVSTLYITKENQKNWDREQKDNTKYGYEYAPLSQFYSEELLVDAQSGELMIFTLGDDKTYSDPRIITWDDV